MKRSSPIDPPASKNSSRKRGPVEAMLLEIARQGGYRVVKVAPAKMAASKGVSRVTDRKMIQSGKATPAQIQAKNDLLPGEVEVNDWSPIFT